MSDWPQQNDSPQSSTIMRIEFAILLAISVAGIILSFI